MAISFLLAFALSIDALGIGITYGVQKISIPLSSRLLLAVETYFMMCFFLFIGGKMIAFFPPFLAQLLSTGFLFFFGLWLCYQGFCKKKESTSPLSAVQQPSVCNKDNSSALEPKEAIFLGFILSLDSFGIGVSVALSGSSYGLLPLFSAFFQITFLCIGAFLGGKIALYTNIEESLWTRISGGILIFIALLKIV